MRVRVDLDLCQGHGVCMSEAPEVFRVEDGGSVEILQIEPPESLRVQLADALRYCPTGAISIGG